VNRNRYDFLSRMPRAREKCVIFSNFRAQDLDAEKTNSVGVRALKSFLEFAECGTLGRISEKTVDESSFEDTVYSFLVSNGVNVHRNVGCSGYKMDFAVPDPENAGKYILGIECDGVKYHNARVCRDRDRLRKQILTGLGWQIFSVWSVDWYLHPEESRKILLETVRKAVGMPVMKDEVEIQAEPISA
jgi:very-short-patch-repair endonuclease